MTRVFVETDLAGRENLVITGDTAHYLLGVLRSHRGNRFVAVDPTGRECEVVVEACAGGELRGRIVSVREAAAEPTLQLTLYQALLKGKNFELVLQKCTELGVTRIVPMVTTRTIPRPDEERLEERGERWSKIVEEACRQCGRNRPPTLAQPVAWDEALADLRSSGLVGLLPYEELAGDSRHSLREALAGLNGTPRVAVFIGPEGGFSRVEAEQARTAGVLPVSLGPRILRAETAAIAACAVVIYELGDL